MRKMRHEKLSNLSVGDCWAKTEATRWQTLCSYPLPLRIYLPPTHRKEPLIPGHHRRERRVKNSFLWTLIP